MKTPEVSIIIPCLNEETALRRLLPEIQKQKNLVSEILVVDGGSSDATRTVAEQYGARVLQTPRGRGRQMNEGAEFAQSPLLFFLHADSFIEDDALFYQAISHLRTYPGCQTAGHFALRFIGDNCRSLGYFNFEEKTKLNRERNFGGDQGLLIYREFFEKVGRFDEKLPFLEDKAISIEILRKGRFITLPGYLGTSARRFESEGFGRRQLLNSLIQACFYASLHGFFEVPAVYKEQHASRKLHLHPYFQFIHRNASPEHWYRIGRFVRGNAWQLFLFADNCLLYFFNFRGKPFLTFHDKILRPLTNFWLFDAIGAIVTYAVGHALWGYYALLDGIAISRRKT